MKQVLRFLFIVLLLINIILTFALRIRLNRANYDLLRLNRESAIVHTTMENIFLCREMEAQSERVNLSPDVVITDIHGDISTLVDIISEPTLVYRFSEMHCNSCIELSMKLLKEASGTTKAPIAIFCRYSNVRQVRAICNSYNIELPIYNIPDKLNIPVDDMSIPYFFIIDEYLKCSSFQSFIKEVPTLTERYLDGIFKVN